MRDTDVGELDDRVRSDDRRSRRGDEDVAGCDVPVHDAGLVSGGERGGDLRPDDGDLLRRERAALGEQAAEAARGQMLHDEPEQAVLGQHVEDRHDVRVVQGRGDPGLARRVIQRSLGLDGGQVPNLHPLDRDVAPEHLIARPPDRPRPARADQLAQPVPAGEHPAGLVAPHDRSPLDDVGPPRCAWASHPPHPT